MTVLALTFGLFIIAMPSHRAIIKSLAILENVTERRCDDKLSTLTSCLAEILGRRSHQYSNRISLLLSDASPHILDLVQQLMRELHRSDDVYTLNLQTMDTTVRVCEVAANTVIISESALALKTNGFPFANLCGRDNNLLLVLANFFIDEKELLKETELMEEMRFRWQSKLAILASVGDSIHLYDPPQLLARCQRLATVTQWQSLTEQTDPRESHEDRNDASCVVNAAMFHNFPYATLTNDTAGYSKFHGVEGLMIEEIARGMKVQLNRETIAWTNDTSIEDELYARLYNTTENDLVFGGLLWYPDMATEYTASYGMVHITWIVPTQTNVSLRGLITPFSANVWYAIVCALIIGGLAELFLIRDISFLNIAALVFGVATYRQPTKASSRIQFLSWAFFGFFLTQLYLGSLADQLTNASSLQMESVKELASSGLKIGGTARFAGLLKTPDRADDDDDNDHEKVLRKIRENFITFQQHAYIDQLSDLVEGKNSSLALIAMLNLTDMHRLSDLGHGHILKETLGSYPLALATWRGFPYLNNINFKILSLVQVGLVNFWSETMTLSANYYRAEKHENVNSNLDLEDIAPAFLLLIIGYIGGCCLLIIEATFYPSEIFL